MVVREWLHETCVVPQSGLGPGATTGYWTLTKNRIMQGVRMGGSGTGVDGGKGKEREGAVLVSELDPDAPLRDSKTLDTEDAVSSLVSHSEDAMVDIVLDMFNL